MKKFLYHIRNLYFRLYVSIFFSGRLKKALYASDFPGSLLRSYLGLRSDKNNRALCNAPFKSMYLGIDGNIYPCCFNREINFGSYNDKPFNETWNGKIINGFRDDLKEYRFPAGCASCREHFLGMNFHAMGARDYDIVPFRKDQPSELIFELSDKCNYRCIMCKGSEFDWLKRYKGCADEKTISISHLTEKVETILPKLHKVKFLGGEPFFIDIYYSIWEKIISVNPNCIIEVQTNGSILDERVKKILEKGRFRIGVSIDSLDALTYKRIRGGDLQNVLKNIEYFHQYVRRKKTRLFFSFCPMTINWKEIPAIVNFCNSYNAHLFFNTVKTPSSLSLFSLSCKQLEPIINSFNGSGLSSGNYIRHINKKRYTEFIGELTILYHQLLQSEKKHKDEFELLLNTSVAQLMEEMKTRYRLIVHDMIEKSNINAPFESISSKIQELYPEDIYVKILLKRIIMLPREKFEKVFNQDFHDEFFRRFSHLYSQTKAMGIGDSI